MSAEDKEHADLGDRLSHFEDVDAALDNLLITCEHVAADVLVSAMAEVFGQLVRRGRIGAAEVAAMVEDAMPPHVDEDAGTWPEHPGR